MSEVTGQVETRDEAVERIVREMIDANVDLTQRGLPELPVLNTKLGEAFDEAVEAGLEDDEGWDEVTADERKQVVERLKGGEAKDSDGGTDEGPRQPAPKGVTKPRVYPTTVYQPGHKSKVVADEAAFKRAAAQGFKPFRDHSIEQQRAMHPMWQNGQLQAND